MSTTYLSETQFKRWFKQGRRSAGRLLTEAGKDEMRREGGWRRCPFALDPLVAAYPGLHLAPGQTLRAYLYESGGNGNGIVWAMGQEADFPEPSACRTLSKRFLEPPRPKGAVEPMRAVAGDGTPRSYLAASLLMRELWEFGALWHGVSWGCHEPVEEARLEGEWEWHEPRPADWRPIVTMAADRVEVSFYTTSPLGQLGLYLHTDTYRPDGGYLPESRTARIASGEGYMVF